MRCVAGCIVQRECPGWTRAGALIPSRRRMVASLGGTPPPPHTRTHAHRRVRTTRMPALDTSPNLEAWRRAARCTGARGRHKTALHSAIDAEAAQCAAAEGRRANVHATRQTPPTRLSLLPGNAACSMPPPAGGRDRSRRRGFSAGRRPPVRRSPAARLPPASLASARQRLPHVCACAPACVRARVRSWAQCASVCACAAASRSSRGTAARTPGKLSTQTTRSSCDRWRPP
jgi:hypothetical protein